MKSKKRHYIIPIFVPHKGCPHDCVFCNQKKITGFVDDFNESQIVERIESYMTTLPIGSDSTVEIAFFGGSFTGIEPYVQKKYLSIAKSYLDQGFIQDIRLSTRPDKIDDNCLTLLKHYGVTIIELGVQSLDEQVLLLSNRGHSKKSVEIASKMILDQGFKLGLQMMIGLPGDTLEKALITAEKLVELGPNFVRIYPALVIKDTEMANMMMMGTYRPLTVEEAVSWAVQAYKVFIKASIPVIRIGLQPSDNIAEGKDVLAGPFHPAFRQVVESALIQEQVDAWLDMNNDKAMKLVIEHHPKNKSNIVGQKKSNLKHWKESFGVENIEFKESSKLSLRDLKLRLVDRGNERL